MTPQVPTRPVLLLITATILVGCAPNTSGFAGDSDPSAPTETPSIESSASPGGSGFKDLDAGWTELPAPPEVRTSTASAWTGDHLLVWGGYVYTGFNDEIPNADGFIFDARAMEWSSITDAPLSPRSHPGAAWTGYELLVWGGSDNIDGFFGDGAAYDPASKSWRKLPDAPLSPRAPLSVWTGDELLLWGSKFGTVEDPAAGAAYNPVTDEWRAIADAPLKLTRAHAAWTGTEMIAFGEGGPTQPSHEEFAVGIAYEPTSDSWRRLPESSLTEEATTIAWSGRELIAWDYGHDSAAYDPNTNQWRTLPRVPLRSYECGPKSVSVARYVFGDYCGAMAVYDRADGKWHDISRRGLTGSWGFTIVAADPVVLLLGRNVDTEEEAMFAYRPPTW